MAEVLSKNEGRPVVDIGYVEPVLGGFAHEILPYLFLGPHDCCTSTSTRSELLEKKITSIVNCSINSRDSPSTHKDIIKYCEVSLHDNEGASLLPWLMPVTEFIHRDIMSGGRCLVHCQMGISRSSAVVIAYLMRYHEMKRDTAYVFTKMRRPQINPNYGFWEQLLTFQYVLEKERETVIDSDSKRNSYSYSYSEVAPFADDWIENSFVTFSTFCNTSSSSGCAEAFDKLRKYRHDKAIVKTALRNGLYFVLSSGLNKMELAWFCAMVKCYSDLFPVDQSACSGEEVSSSGVKDIISILGSEQFRDEWGSEFRPRDEQLLMDSLRVL